MDDRASLAYAALPERIYIVTDGNIAYEVRSTLFSFVNQLKKYFEGRAWSPSLQHPGG